jgi:hypothetical protein
MADSDSNPINKPHVYDLLGRLNGAFARVHKTLEAIGNVGIFDQQTMQPLNQLADELRAISNARLLSVLQGIEERDLTEICKTT